MCWPSQQCLHTIEASGPAAVGTKLPVDIYVMHDTATQLGHMPSIWLLADLYAMFLINPQVCCCS